MIVNSSFKKFYYSYFIVINQNDSDLLKAVIKKLNL